MTKKFDFDSDLDEYTDTLGEDNDILILKQQMLGFKNNPDVSIAEMQEEIKENSSNETAPAEEVPEEPKEKKEKKPVEKAGKTEKKAGRPKKIVTEQPATAIIDDDEEYIVKEVSTSRLVRNVENKRYLVRITPETKEQLHTVAEQIGAASINGIIKSCISYYVKGADVDFGEMQTEMTDTEIRVPKKKEKRTETIGIFVPENHFNALRDKCIENKIGINDCLNNLIKYFIKTNLK